MPLRHVKIASLGNTTKAETNNPLTSLTQDNQTHMSSNPQCPTNSTKG